MIPFKSFAFEYGINYTAGLPIIRTSPAHGTAFDIAGKNIASPASFRQAIYTAIDIYKNRKQFIEANKNPLPVNPPPDKHEHKKPELTPFENANNNTND
jgi:4-hydroxythreonine-4-phosphate dehydrogenase